MSAQSACPKKYTLQKHESRKLYLVSSKVCTTVGTPNKLTSKQTRKQTFGETRPVCQW